MQLNLNLPVNTLFSWKTAGNYKKVFLVLLGVWFTINLIQALFMEILGDEAYYKSYAEYPDWGYYDHPSIIALMVKVSSIFFTGNLGVRFLTLLLQLGTLTLIWMTMEKKEPDTRSVYTFFIVAGSICMFSGYGVITTPDAPLLFFTALLLFSYKKFIGSRKWSVTLLLAFAMAALVYSKYHAVLIIGFVVLSNFSLLRSYKFWIAAILALIIVSPHLYWQFSHDFPSFQYHLAYRLEDFELKHVLEYLPNQMALMNPFTLSATVFVLIKYAPAGQFKRSLYFQVIGFLVFFWLISIRDHVEPNWTIACSIPMIIILSEKITEIPALYRYSRRIILPSLSLVLASRIILMSNNELTRSIGYSGKMEKYKFIETVAKDLPVVFLGSYQPPSLYHFYTGREGIVLSSLYSRQTQFDIWQFEKKYHNKPAFISSVTDPRSQIYQAGSIHFHGFKTDSLQTVNRININYELEKKSFYPGDSINIACRIKNPYDYPIDFHHRQFPTRVCLVLIKGKDTKDMIFLDVSLSKDLTTLKEGQLLQSNLSAVMPDLPYGRYKLGVCLTNTFGPSFNSRFKDIRIAGDNIASSSKMPHHSRLGSF